MTEEEVKESWHLSKSVPIALVLALIVQTIALVSWAATFKAEFEAFRAEARKELIDVQSDIEDKTRDRITSREVFAELRARDQRMQSLEKDDDQLVKELARLHQILTQRLDRIETKIDHAVSITNGK